MVNQSITTKIEPKALELGRSVMKSIHIEDQGFYELKMGIITNTNDDKEPWNMNICHML